MSLEQIYPGGYFDHWLAMLGTMDGNMDEVGFKNHLQNYIHYEGKNEFIALQEEVKLIDKNNDISKFKKVAENWELSGITEMDLETMVRIIIDRDVSSV